MGRKSDKTDEEESVHRGLTGRELTDKEITSAEDISALIPAYTIGATDPDESKYIQRLLEESADEEVGVGEELSDYISLTHLLMHGTPQLQPPSRIASQLQSSISQQAESKQSILDNPSGKSWLDRLVSRWSWSQLAAAAAILLLIALNLSSLTQLRSVQQAQAELTDEISRHRAAMVMLTSEEIEEIIVPAVDETEEAFVSLFWHPEWDIAVIYAEEFPQLAPEMTYQLWLNDNGQRVSGGTFSVNTVGNGTLIMRPAQPINMYEVIGITAEPEGGSSGPTSAPVVRFEAS